MLSDPDFADLVLIVLAAPIILGAAWAQMVRTARRDEARRWPKGTS